MRVQILSNEDDRFEYYEPRCASLVGAMLKAAYEYIAISTSDKAQAVQTATELVEAICSVLDSTGFEDEEARMIKPAVAFIDDSGSLLWNGEEPYLHQFVRNVSEDLSFAGEFR